MMPCSRRALLLSMSSVLLIPTKYVPELSRVIAEPLLVNTEQSGSREGVGGNWVWGNVTQVWESGFQQLRVGIADVYLWPERVCMLIKVTGVTRGQGSSLMVSGQITFDRLVYGGTAGHTVYFISARHLTESFRIPDGQEEIRARLNV